MEGSRRSVALFLSMAVHAGLLGASAGSMSEVLSVSADSRHRAPLSLTWSVAEPLKPPTIPAVETGRKKAQTRELPVEAPAPIPSSQRDSNTPRDVEPDDALLRSVSSPGSREATQDDAESTAAPQSLASSVAKEPHDRALEPSVLDLPDFLALPDPPKYPRRAERRGYEGTVVLHALVAEPGEPRDLRVVQSSGHPSLDAAALEAVRRWKFRPATRDGHRLVAWVRVPVEFSLR